MPKIFLHAKIFVRKEIHVKEVKEKKEKNITQSCSNCIWLNVLFDCCSYEQNKNNMTANKEELSITVQKYRVIFDKSNNDFHCKDVKKNAWEAVAKELGFESGK